VTVVWLKDSGQAVTCLDCKYRETLLEALPKPKLKWHRAPSARRDEKRENLIDPCRTNSPDSTLQFPPRVYITHSEIRESSHSSETEEDSLPSCSI